jgi:hypothetical protein
VAAGREPAVSLGEAGSLPAATEKSLPLPHR